MYYIIKFGVAGKSAYTHTLAEALAVADALAKVYSGVTVNEPTGKLIKQYL